MMNGFIVSLDHVDVFDFDAVSGKIKALSNIFDPRETGSAFKDLRLRI